MPSEDSKPVKKVKVGENEIDDKTLGSGPANGAKKPNNAGPKSRSPKQAKVKKEEANDDDDDDFEKPTRNNSRNMNEKVQKKNKVKEEEENNNGVKQTEKNNVKKREKKVYDLPGQKRDPPEERDPLRIFYETLYKQVPGSEMAGFWMMESGLLSKEVAKKVFEKKQEKNQQQKLGSPLKTIVAVKKTSQSVTVKRKISSSPVSSKRKKTPDTKVAPKQSQKRKIEEDGASEDESNDDYVLVSKMTKKRKVA